MKIVLLAITLLVTTTIHLSTTTVAGFSTGTTSSTLCSRQHQQHVVPTRQQPPGSRTIATTSTSTRLTALFSPDLMEARQSFPYWLFGATGSGGIARSAIPRLYDEWKEIQALKGQGPTKGGPTIGLSPLAGFPEDVCLADVQQVLDNKLTISQIVQQHPVEDNFLSNTYGYLTLEAYCRANAKCNPLAVRAVFDAFGKKLTVEPALAQQKLDDFRANPSLVAQGVVQGRVVTIAAVLTLLFLLGLADVATATDAYFGYFPTWPGGSNFPWSMFTQVDGSPLAIPKYFDAS